MSSIYRYEYDSFIGTLYILCSEKEVLSLTTKEIPLENETIRKQKLPIIKQIIKWLDLYFQGDIPDFEIPLNPKGTQFQNLVWQELQKIKYGSAVSYQEIAIKVAAKMGKTQMSAQAVGNAVKKNPILILIPCHRVLGKKGNLVGFNAGLEIKAKLLKLEKITLKNE